MESSTPERQTVKVTILSRPYTLMVAGDPRETEEVAASVNELMLSIAGKAPNADSTRIAVLACLHLADKLRPQGARPQPSAGARGPEIRRVRGDARAVDRSRGRACVTSRVLLLLLAGIALGAVVDYPSELAAWRRDREAKLKAEGGWLSVAGLFWLNEGPNRFGAAQSNEIVLPDGPASAGVFELRAGKVTLRMNGSTRAIRTTARNP
jgi:hypothetical protein